MHLNVTLSNKLSLLHETLRFLKRHLIIILGLGFIAAFGRVIQLGGFGKITLGANALLEVVIEFARLLIFVYVLGLASFKMGALRIKQLITDKNSRILYWRAGVQNIKRKWIEILLNFSVFLLITWLINYLIDLLAYQTCLYLTLRKSDILNHASSEWTIILFFKNISVIPFALAFEALFLLWVINQLRNRNLGTVNNSIPESGAETAQY